MDSNLVIGLIALAGFLTWATWTRHHVLLGVSASLTWFALAMWLFFSAVPILGFAENFEYLLGGVFFLLTFLPLLLLMDVEVTHERGGRKWREYSAGPKDKETSYTKYRTELRRRVRR